MRILVLGAKGMLGFALHRILSDAGWVITGTVRDKHRPASPWCRGLDYVTRVDAENFRSVEKAVERVQATMVINAIGIKTANDNASRERMLAVNSVFPRRLGHLAGQVGFRLLHFSSDGVFSGDLGPYSESMMPDAKDLYGISKYLGEPDGKQILTLRTSLIGRSIDGEGSLIDWLLSQTGEIKGYRRVLFSGFPADEIANVVGRYILPKIEKLQGRVHLSSHPITKAELLELVRKAWSLDYIKIVPDDELVINRCLDSSRLKRLIGYEPPSWQQMVSAMRHFYARLEDRGGAT